MVLKIVIVCVFVFLAGFIDSIAGGGGLISLPAYFFIGLPIHNVLATNKFSAAMGTTFSTIRFYQNKALDWKVGLVSAFASFFASYFAAKIVLLIDETILKVIFAVSLPALGVFLLLKKDFGKKNFETDRVYNFKTYFLAFLIGLLIGFYDGVIGPCTGTFAIIAYSSLMKYDLVTSSGNAKILNLASNYASVAAFLPANKIVFKIGIPAAICGIIGNLLGSSVAIKKGNSFVKIIILLVLVLLFGKLVYDLVSAFTNTKSAAFIANLVF